MGKIVLLTIVQIWNVLLKINSFLFTHLTFKLQGVTSPYCCVESGKDFTLMAEKHRVAASTPLCYDCHLTDARQEINGDAGMWPRFGEMQSKPFTSGHWCQHLSSDHRIAAKVTMKLGVTLRTGHSVCILAPFTWRPCHFMSPSPSTRPLLGKQRAGIR